MIANRIGYPIATPIAIRISGANRVAIGYGGIVRPGPDKYLWLLLSVVAGLLSSFIVKAVPRTYASAANATPSDPQGASDE